MLKVVLTCEHGGNRIPEKYQPLFRGQVELLNSHRGYDIGALPLFVALKAEVADASFFAEESRLLVDLNRSQDAPDLLSPFSMQLPVAEQQALLQEYYFPYRMAVESKIRELQREGNQVLHVSIHTFTPALKGEQRQAAVGLLFDPAREKEKQFCEGWRAFLQQETPELTVRMNYPYLGTADGLTTFLRSKFSPEAYMGIEIEVNQEFFLNRNKGRQTAMAQALRRTLVQLISTAKKGA